MNKLLTMRILVWNIVRELTLSHQWCLNSLESKWVTSNNGQSQSVLVRRESVTLVEVRNLDGLDFADVYIFVASWLKRGDEHHRVQAHT